MNNGRKPAPAVSSEMKSEQNMERQPVLALFQNSNLKPAVQSGTISDAATAARETTLIEWQIEQPRKRLPVLRKLLRPGEKIC